jgi:hypothetical protein
MTRRERLEIRERGLTLWSTGRYASRQQAEAVAREQLEAERDKRETATANARRTSFTLCGIGDDD